MFDKIDKNIKLGLERIEKAVKLLNLDLSRFKSVLVAGTNGKGSTSIFLENILRKHKFKTALYLSPHFENIEERLVLGGNRVSLEDLKERWRFVRSFSDKHGLDLTPFEVFTLACFELVCEFSPDIFVAEVGLGGRLDATNVLSASVSVITGVGLDHTEFLGKRLVEIAEEKAGVIKPEKPLILGRVWGDAFKVVCSRAEAKRAQVFLLGRDFRLKLKRSGVGFQFSIDSRDFSFSNLFVPKPFRFFCYNAALAIAAASFFCRLREDLVRKALLDSFIPGRCELLEFGGKKLILDVAHNPEGLGALLWEVHLSFNGEKKIFLGLLKDKPVKKMLELAKRFGEVFLVRVEDERGLSEFPGFRSLFLDEALEIFKKEKTGVFIFAGSFWLARNVKRKLKDAHVFEA